jgi:hypothetical protein
VTDPQSPSRRVRPWAGRLPPDRQRHPHQPVNIQVTPVRRSWEEPEPLVVPTEVPEGPPIEPSPEPTVPEREPVSP